jgi:single-strand DNA-binding protein
MSARSLNKAMLIGNLTRDPELRYTPQGTAVCSFGLATNRSWMPSDSSERREETEFHRIVSWNKLAELCSQLLTKGRKVYIEGRLQTRSWESGDGEKRQATEIVAEDMVILDQKRPVIDEGGGKKEKEESEVKSEEKSDSKAEKAKGDKDKDVDDKEKKGKEKKGKGDDKDEKSKEKGAEGEDEIDIDDIPF